MIVVQRLCSHNSTELENASIQEFKITANVRSVQTVCARLFSSRFQSLFDSLVDVTRKAVLKITWRNSRPPSFSDILRMAPGEKLGLSSTVCSICLHRWTAPTLGKPDWNFAFLQVSVLNAGKATNRLTICVLGSEDGGKLLSKPAQIFWHYSKNVHIKMEQNMVCFRNTRDACIF